jgi:orotate phosphoribosyltransferase
MLKKRNIDIISILGENDAITDGHFELPCGLHIQSYVDTTVVMQYPSVASRIAASLADLFDKKPDVVLAPTAENSILAQEVARVKNARSVFAVIENGVMKLKGSMHIKTYSLFLLFEINNLR